MNAKLKECKLNRALDSTSDSFTDAFDALVEVLNDYNDLTHKEKQQLESARNACRTYKNKVLWVKEKHGNEIELQED